jgi:hypothetical protein
MDLSERIESCIAELDARRRQMALFESKVKHLLDALNVQGGAPGALGEALAMLEGVLSKYGEIDQSCRRMIEGLQEIGQHLGRIEEGRRKIVEGVERILANLGQLDRMAREGLVLGAGQDETEHPGRAKRVLLIRLRPETEAAPKGRRVRAPDEATELDEGEDRDLIEPDGTTVH